MISYIKANFWTIVIVIILIIIVALIIRKLINDKKNGVGTCGGDCSRCHSGCANATSQDFMVKTTITIDGMVCGMCESHINDIIRQSFEIKKIKSSYKTGKAIVISPQRLDNKAIRDAIGKTGYVVKSIDIEPCK